MMSSKRPCAMKIGTCWLAALRSAASVADVSLYGGPWNYVTVDIPETGTYLLSSEGPVVPFHHCAPCSERDISHATNGFFEPAVEAEMVAGRYVAYQSGLFGGNVTLDIAIDRVVP
jgi:hypothetical protein